MNGSIPFTIFVRMHLEAIYLRSNFTFAPNQFLGALKNPSHLHINLCCGTALDGGSFVVYGSIL